MEFISFISPFIDLIKNGTSFMSLLTYNSMGINLFSVISIGGILLILGTTIVKFFI